MTEGTAADSQDAQPAAVAVEAGRPLWLGVRRGIAHRCPECGQGRLYNAYLKVEDVCESCGHVLGDYRADDGPAYVTILLVGHLVVAPLLLFPFIWQWPAIVVVPLTLGPLASLVLMALPRVKGAFLGAMWAARVQGARD